MKPAHPPPGDVDLLVIEDPNLHEADYIPWDRIIRFRHQAATKSEVAQTLIYTAIDPDGLSYYDPGAKLCTLLRNGGKGGSRFIVPRILKGS